MNSSVRDKTHFQLPWFLSLPCNIVILFFSSLFFISLIRKRSGKSQRSLIRRRKRKYASSSSSTSPTLLRFPDDSSQHTSCSPTIPYSSLGFVLFFFNHRAGIIYWSHFFIRIGFSGGDIFFTFVCSESSTEDDQNGHQVILLN